MIPIIVLLGVAGMAYLLVSALRGPSTGKSVKRRLEVMKERHAGGAVVANANAQIRKLHQASESRAEGIMLSLIPNPVMLRKRLAQTGKEISLAKFGGMCLGITLFVMAIMLFKHLPIYLALVVGLFVGLGLPHKAISRMIKKRGAKFTSNFPDAIDLMVRGLRSGLPITETLGIVASEIHGPVGDEFKLVSDKMKIGRTMEVALQETADRMGTAEFQFFVITLAIQRETGGNLAETLGNLSEVLRKRSQMKLKIRAMSSESKASAMIVGSLPFIVFGLVYVMNPTYMGKFFEDQRLIVAGLGGMVWMGTGVFIMAKMVNFEI